MTHASTFSGIGGPEIAAAMLGWDNLFHCEINPFGRQILDYYFPNAKSYEDITKTDFSEWRGRVDVLTGGFPCQPFSTAGKRRGAEDDRYLWPFMLRAIEQIRPAWFVGENVGGIATMVLPGSTTQVAADADIFGACDTYETTRQRYVLDEICRNLESIGYDVQPFLIPACAVGAPHRRDRIFIVARNVKDADSVRAERGTFDEVGLIGKQYGNAESTSNGWQAGFPSTNADGRNAGARAGANEGKGKGKGLQERHAVQQPCKPNQVRPESVGASTDANGSGRGTQTTRGGSLGSWRDGLSEQGERSETAERLDRLPDVPRNTTDAEHDRLERSVDGRSEGTQDGSTCSGREDGRPFEPASAQADGRGQSAPDPTGRRSGRLRNASETKMARMRDELPRERGGLFDDRMHPTNRWRAFPTVAPICRGNDGLPFSLDDLTISASKWRTESLKAYGNAIVPQVMYTIFSAIEEATNGNEQQPGA